MCSAKKKKKKKISIINWNSLFKFTWGMFHETNNFGDWIKVAVF